ncbi:MAG: putative accessory gene regulator protein [Pelotomaculum sp. PtaB.Bin013]|uniref:Accessory gene regulator B family protein n=1 Tax=Pelotomaculum isophthalicicum JI TaxID=947010 RepID=A0A9X4H1A1_9FIRM|nr:accessory gene regulator B family protein [Pelotomaculum isophthalicicum]MDF9407441.1 accessory gene regulator B family protein [Pelotomaculum isophthalicicum JI]OPX90314.1 MAG: putative accessory gene regulator protein [Pelotomaculum sp. PtaB.Bin013]
MSYLAFSKRWANYLTVRTGLSHEKELVLTYVIEVLTLNLINIVAALMLGMLFGVLPGTATGIFIATLYRHTAGGAHSNSPWRCGIITITIYPLIALSAVKLSTLGKSYADILTASAIILGFVAMILLAPVDSPAAPIISPSRRKRLKISALIIMLTLSALLVVLSQITWDYARQLQMCIVVCIVWLSLMLTKQGHKLISFVDNIKLG